MTESTASIREPEIDMNRYIEEVHYPGLHRLLSLILRFQQHTHRPRRSIDREEQEYSPFWE
jgi:hypothetical protein